MRADDGRQALAHVNSVASKLSDRLEESSLLPKQR